MTTVIARIVALVWCPLLCDLLLTQHVAALETPSAEVIDTLDRRIQSLVEEGRYVGLAVSVRRAGAPLLEKGYGAANVEWELSVSPDAIFEIGSLSKTITALAVAALAEDGKLALSDTVSDYLPEAPEAIGRLPLARLLDHTSGLGSFTSSAAFADYRLNPYLSLEQARDFVLANSPVLFLPGEAWSYSNSGTWLLSYIVEQASGEPFGDYVRRRIFMPLGMHSSRLNDYVALMPRRVDGYVPVGDGEVRRAFHEPPVVPYGAGAFVSTVGDMQRYLDALLGTGGSALSKALVDGAQHSGLLNDGRIASYTQGALMSGDFFGHRQYAHSGGIEGFSTYMSSYPDDKLSIVLLANLSGAPVGALEREIAGALLGVPPLPGIAESLPRAVEQYVGHYRLTARYGMFGAFAIQAAGDRLQLTFDGYMLAGLPPLPLQTLDDGRMFTAMGGIDVIVDLKVDDGVIAFNGSRYVFARDPKASVATGEQAQ
jgi:CubicO group peptidase (beta-lactamase class C family)